LLLLRGTCIVNEAMLSGESTPLLKESTELRETDERLDIDGTTKASVLFSGTKVLQAGGGGLSVGGYLRDFVSFAVFQGMTPMAGVSPSSCAPGSGPRRASSCAR